MTCYHFPEALEKIQTHIRPRLRHFQVRSETSVVYHQARQRSIWLGIPTNVNHESRSNHLLRHSPAARFKVLPKQYVFVFQLRSPVGNQSHHPDRPHHADPGPDEKYRSLAVNG